MFTNELGFPRLKQRGSLSQTQLARKPIYNQTITYLPRLNTYIFTKTKYRLQKESDLIWTLPI